MTSTIREAGDAVQWHEEVDILVVGLGAAGASAAAGAGGASPSSPIIYE